MVSEPLHVSFAELTWLLFYFKDLQYIVLLVVHSCPIQHRSTPLPLIIHKPKYMSAQLLGLLHVAGTWEAQADDLIT